MRKRLKLWLLAAITVGILAGMYGLWQTWQTMQIEDCAGIEMDARDSTQMYRWGWCQTFVAERDMDAAIYRWG